MDRFSNTPTAEQSEAHAELVAVINAHMHALGPLQLMALTSEIAGRLLRHCHRAGVEADALQSTISRNMALGVAADAMREADAGPGAPFSGPVN